jgi:hypothetical protein
MEELQFDAGEAVTGFGGRARRLAWKARRALEILHAKQYIFVLSHMRSYSSLLCHILNSNPEVAGYVETHAAYAGRSDLWRLKKKVFLGTDAALGGRYVLDKILHNRCRINPVLLRRDDVFVIFSLREPRRTIQSTVAMARALDPADWKADPKRVTQAYVRRVKELRRLAYQELRHAIFIEAQRLIDDSPRVLAELTRFLSLQQPLSEEYRTSRLTGVQVYGDPGKYIRSGSIVREREDYSEIELSDLELEPALEAYAAASEALRSLG